MSASTPSNARTALWQILLGETLIGSVGVFVHESGQDAVTAVFYRCLFGAAFLLAWCAVRGHLRVLREDRRLVAGAAVSGVLLVLSWVALFAGMARSSIGVATMLFHAYPFVMLILAAVFVGERARAADWGWTAVAFAGLVASADPARVFQDLDPTYRLGVALTLVSGVLCGASLMISRQVSSRQPVVSVAVQCGIGALMLGGFSDPKALHFGPHWGWLAGLGVIHSGISYVLLYSSYRSLSIATIAVLSFVYPIVALLLDFLVYGQRLGVVQMAGLGLIMVGTLGVNLKWGWHRARAGQSLGPGLRRASRAEHERS